VVEPGSDSLTVRPKSPAELGVALTVLAQDAMLRRRLGQAALAKAQRYSWRMVAAQVIQVYQEAREVKRAAGEKEAEQSVHHSLPSVG
jgi:glycosyltransferase involved in cell wall biosynthesis